jgi:hypothetical protein
MKHGGLLGVMPTVKEKAGQALLVRHGTRCQHIMNVCFSCPFKLSMRRHHAPVPWLRTWQRGGEARISERGDDHGRGIAGLDRKMMGWENNKNSWGGNSADYTKVLNLFIVRSPFVDKSIAINILL